MRVLITGGSGFIGKRLCRVLLDRGHDLTVLTRNSDSAREALHSSVQLQVWNPDKSDPKLTFPVGIDGVVNLAGESIAGGRWTKERKSRIRSSRTRATNALVAAMRDSD